MEYVPKKRVIFNVRCSADPGHVFEKVFELSEGQERPGKETGIDAFCPYCSKIVPVTVMEKTPPDKDILKRFEEQDKELGLKYKNKIIKQNTNDKQKTNLKVTPFTTSISPGCRGRQRTTECWISIIPT